MRQYLRHLFVLFISALCAIPAIAQQPGEATGLPAPLAGEIPLRFDHITLDDGLSQGSIFAIYQDRKGFMWFGTEDGLNRYDGYDFTVYKSIPFDSTSLSENTITDIYQTGDGSLWVGTGGGGLNRMDPRTHTFTAYRHDPADSSSISSDNITALAEDAAGALWVGTPRGLNRMDTAAGTFERFETIPDDSTTLSHNIITSIHGDPSGDVWVGTHNGLNQIDTETGQVKRYLDIELDPNSYNQQHPESIITGFIQTDPGDVDVLWASTGQGLVRLNTATDEHERLMPEEGRSFKNVLMDATFAPDDPSTIWAVSNTTGLYRFDLTTETFTHYPSDPLDEASPNTDNLLRIYADRMGTIWAGAQIGQGLTRFDPSAGSFARYRHIPGDTTSLSPGPVWGIYEAPSEPEALWIGTGSEQGFGSGVLHRMDRATGTIERWQFSPTDPESLGPGTVGSMLEDSQGNFWVGTWGGGLNHMDRETGTFTRYLHDPADSTSLSNNMVFKVYEDRRGDLWVASFNGGLNRMDREAGTFTRYQHDPEDDTSISGNAIRGVYETQDGAFWVATTSGLNRMDRETGTFTRYQHDPADPSSLSNNHVLTVHERKEEPGILWVGTYGGGLDRLDTRTDTFTHFTEATGLPNNSIYGILEDEEGDLWMSTNAGITRFDPETETFSQYGTDSGLQSKEFNGGAYSKSARGEMFFGGPNGFNAFFPHQIDANPRAPEVVINSVRLFGLGQATETGNMIDRADGEAVITLDHDQKNLSFDYVGLHYLNPDQNRYRYLLDGYDEDWNDVGTRRTAIYTNLDPGEYTFRVKSANSDGVWSKDEAALRLKVLPPWWRTWWAYGLYGLLLAVGIFAVDRFQRRRLLAREREAAQIRENELRAEAAEARALALQAENERKTLELEGARQLQLSMLPRDVPAHPDVELAAYMKTATEVGGDYYDFNIATDGTLTLAIGDATGHGMQAGTMVTATKSALSVLAEEPQGLDRMLARSTVAIKKMGLPKLFMALALARLRGNTLELAGAGMPPALHYRPATRSLRPLPLKGMPLGGPAGFPYEMIQVDLEPGDTVVFMSDGFPELFDGDGEMLGYNRAIAEFEKVADRSPTAVIQHFSHLVDTWTNGKGPDDDVTFIVMRMRDSQQAGVNGQRKTATSSMTTDP